MRRSSPGYFDRPARSIQRRYVAYRCVCGFGTNIHRYFVEHQERCSAVRIAKAAEAQAK